VISFSKPARRRCRLMCATLAHTLWVHCVRQIWLAAKSSISTLHNLWIPRCKFPDPAVPESLYIELFSLWIDSMKLSAKNVFTRCRNCSVISVRSPLHTGS